MSILNKKTQNDKGVPIMLDKPRHIKYDLNAFEKVYKLTGMNLLDGKTLTQMVTPEDFKILLWAGLIHEDKRLTLEQVGAMVSMGNIGVLTEVFKAIAPGKKT